MGDCYLVATSPTGAWAGHQGEIASFTADGWRFTAAVEGVTVYVRSDPQSAVYRDGAWKLGVMRGSTLILSGEQVVGTRGAAIASPSGGSTVDAEARSALGLILATLRQHGLFAT